MSSVKTANVYLGKEKAMYVQVLNCIDLGFLKKEGG